MANKPASRRFSSSPLQPSSPSVPPLRPVAIANRHPRLRLDRRAVAHAIHTLDANDAAILRPRPRRARNSPRIAMPAGELSLVFLTDAALAALHGDFLDDPTTTDVITFEGDAASGLPLEAAYAGEICVSVDTAATYARKHRRDFSTELTLYLIHGWLHLAGHDDLEPAKKRAMRRAEARALRALRQAGAIPVFHLKSR